MKKFDFRFQRLLDLKERMEETRRRALGEAVAQLFEEQERLSQLQHTQTSYRQNWQSVAGLNPTLLSLNANYLLRLQREILEQEERVRQAETTVEEKRGELTEATRERRVYETLKDRAAVAYRREQKRQERILLDEAGKQIYLRRKDQAGEPNS